MRAIDRLLTILLLATLVAAPAGARTPGKAPRAGVARAFLGGGAPALSPRDAHLVSGALAAIARRPARWQVNPFTGRNQRLRFSAVEEVTLGEGLSLSVEQSHGGAHPDGTIAAYVQAVGQRIVARNGLARTGYPLRFRVLASETPNAFAIPGGRVYVTRGFLRQLPDEASLALVLGHEIGHVVGRHTSERLAASDVSEALLEAGVASYAGHAAGPAILLRAAWNLRLALADGSRNGEHEADVLGLRFAQGAGYDGAAAALGVVQAFQRLQGAPPSPLDSHPGAAARAATLGRLPMLRGEVGAERYRAFVHARP